MGYIHLQYLDLKGGLALKKKGLAIVAFIVVLINMMNITYAADSPQNAISSSKLQFQQLDQNLVDTNKKIANINEQISTLNSTVEKNNLDIAKITNEIGTTQVKIDEMNKEIASSQELANSRIRAMYINKANYAFFDMILSSNSFSDFFNKLEVAKIIISYDKEIIKALKDKKNALNKTETSLVTQSQSLQKLKNSNTESLKQLMDDKASLIDLTVKYNQQKTLAAETIKENEEKFISFAISVIDLKNTNINELKSAIDTLKSLSPQLITDSVKKKASDYIALGNQNLAVLIANNANPSTNSNIIYKAVMTMTATAYTGGYLTAIGLKPVRDPAGLSVIAVDPSVIPLGTKVNIPGYGYAICGDTGSAIKGNIIDLYMDSVTECLNWGIKPVTLYIVAYPGEW
jgi:peptidoglycan DL-endopeptidase CwlO